MVMLGAWQKRLMVYFAGMFIPLVIVYIALLLGLGVIVAFLGGFIISLATTFMIHKVTLNPLAKWELDGIPMLQAVDSLGVLNFYPISVSAQDRVANARVDGKDIAASYSQSNIFETIFHKEKVPAWSTETHMHIIIPKKDAYAHTFKARGVPTFLYNRRGAWFWTKNKFSSLEDGMVLENSVAQLAYSTKNFEEATRNYARSAINKLWEKFNKPGLMWIVIILVILLGLLIFGEDIMAFVEPLMSGPVGSLTQASNSLVPTEATQALK